jgi:hypothetical protein
MTSIICCYRVNLMYLEGNLYRPKWIKTMSEGYGQAVKITRKGDRCVG